MAGRAVLGLILCWWSRAVGPPSIATSAIGITQESIEAAILPAENYKACCFKQHIHCWQAIGAPQRILEWLFYGYAQFC